MQQQLVRIATRNSPLALWQAEHVKQRILDRNPAFDVQLIRMTTRGDILLDSPLAKIGGKGLFVKELETAMLNGDADIAVHSMKDVPAEIPRGLQVKLILQRENPTDAFVSNHYRTANELPDGSVVGTCSLRRQAQLQAKYPKLEFKNLRGNVNTRLAKLDAGEFDAIILATAGLLRLEFENRIASQFSIEDSLPAAGQGVVGIECRADDVFINELLAPLHHIETCICVTAERAFSARLQGGCQVPIGAHATLNGDTVYLRGLVATPDGTQILRSHSSADKKDADQLGVRLAEELLVKGADKILAQVGLFPAAVESVQTDTEFA